MTKQELLEIVDWEIENLKPVLQGNEWIEDSEIEDLRGRIYSLAINYKNFNTDNKKIKEFKLKIK
tara:strand:+ start:1059 stop:1253 length:195 start_codon:yes stop_codon:yes gene_type:complete